MAYGSYAVRYAPTHDKKKWVVEIHKTARAAMKAARTLAVPRAHAGKLTVPVCVFDLSKWNRKPLCIEATGSVQAGHRKHRRARYTYAPDSSKIPRGPLLKRLAKDSQGNPIVKYDGYHSKRR